MFFATKAPQNLNRKVSSIKGWTSSHEPGVKGLEECKIDVREESVYFPKNAAQSDTHTQKSSAWSQKSSNSTKNSSKIFHDIFHSLEGLERFDLEKEITTFLTSIEAINLFSLNKNTWRNVFKNKEILNEYMSHVLSFFKVDEHLNLVHNFFSKITNLPLDNNLRQEVLVKKDKLSSHLNEQKYFNFSFDLDNILNLNTPKLRKNAIKKLTHEFQELKDDISQVIFYEHTPEVTFASGKLAVQRKKMLNKLFLSYLFTLFLTLVACAAIIGENSKLDRIALIIVSGDILLIFLAITSVILFKNWKNLINKVLENMIKDKENNKTTSLLLSGLSFNAQNELKNIYNRNKEHLIHSEDMDKLDNCLKLLFTTDYFQLTKHTPCPLDQPD